MALMWPVTLLVLAFRVRHLQAAEQVNPGMWASLNLPEEHIPYFFYNNPGVAEACEQDLDCPYRHKVNVTRCWGYEKECEERYRMLLPNCPEENEWVKSKEEQITEFWKQADFGQVDLRKSELTTFCEPEHPGDSRLTCSTNTRHCTATNLFIDFTGLNIHESRNRYREDVFTKGQVGGKCRMNSAALKKAGEHKSPLQSWYAELQHFTSLDFNPIEDNKCDKVFEKPTVLIKLDAGINMYHHFCDFLNLYMSQHMNNSFSTDINIIMWDTSPMNYGDFFGDTWKAFTDYPIIPLRDLDGKKVCFRNALFPLLARQRLGLFYNTPIMPGCYGSGMFRAFSQHIIHRLGIKQEGPLEGKVRITLLSRSTTYRQILNQEELVNALNTVGGYEVRVVDYRHMPFLEQLAVTYNSDLFMGMHGAGLTHLLFQPDWGSIFEIYNCEDPRCYFDLARLRGVKYLTWERKEKLEQEDEGHHPTLGAHAKFTNYKFDVTEFMRVIGKAVYHIRRHPAYRDAWEEKHQRPYPLKVKDEYPLKVKDEL